VLSYDVWEREWKQNGYLKAITIPIPIQLPESEKEKLRSYKKELIRIIFIVEGKTEHQRQRRETFYKMLFIKMRIIRWVKSLFAKKEITTVKPKGTFIKVEQKEPSPYLGENKSYKVEPTFKVV